MNAHIQGLKNDLIQESKNVQVLLQQTHDEALLRNEVQINRWVEYRKGHEELSSRLLTLRDSLTHEIMVPLGKKALMRGRLVHTNEILVCLGDGWFAKQSANQAADICQRRIQNCDEILAHLYKEKELLSSRKSIPIEAEAFSEDQTQEVIEPYDEEEERIWRERHRHKEREYRQKLAQIKQGEHIKIETEEDLWKRLDALDEQEEIEDEINRLDVGEDDAEDSENSSSHEDSSESECDERLVNSLPPVNKDVTIKRRVSFKEGLSENNLESSKDTDSSDENIIRIVFRHSDNPPAPLSSQAGLEVTTSPAELYSEYLRNRLPKSILKPSSSLESYNRIIVEPSTKVGPVSEVIKPFLGNPDKEVMVKDVVEKEPSEAPVETTHRPVSRFKAARLASKR